MAIHEKIHEEEVTGREAISVTLDTLLSVCQIQTKKGLGGTGSDNGYYGGVVKVGNSLFLKSYQYPCHAKVRSLDRIQVMYNRFTPRENLSQEARRAFFDWITSDTGPWRTFGNRKKSVLPIGIKEEDALDWIYNHGWVWDDLSYPSNLQHSFLVASRGAAEWPRLITQWNIWRKQGIDPALAYLFLDVFHRVPGQRSAKNKQYWRINQSNSYDWPFDVCTSGEESVRNFIHGRVSGLNPPFKDKPVYTPVNSIWGTNCSYTLTQKGIPVYRDVLYDLYHERFGLSTEASEEFWKNKLGWSQFSGKAYWTLLEEEILSIIRLETERLYDTNYDGAASKVVTTSGRTKRSLQSKG